MPQLFATGKHFGQNAGVKFGLQNCRCEFAALLVNFLMRFFSAAKLIEGVDVRKVATVVALMMTLAAAPARAENSADFIIEELAKDDGVALVVLAAMERGMSWANAELRHSKTPELYCVPAKLAVTPEQVADVFKRFLKDHPSLGKYPAAFVLMEAMKDAFPCN